MLLFLVCPFQSQKDMIKRLHNHNKICGVLYKWLNFPIGTTYPTFTCSKKKGIKCFTASGAVTTEQTQIPDDRL